MFAKLNNSFLQIFKINLLREAYTFIKYNNFPKLLYNKNNI